MLPTAGFRRRLGCEIPGGYSRPNSRRKPAVCSNEKLKPASPCPKRTLRHPPAGVAASEREAAPDRPHDRGQHRGREHLDDPRRQSLSLPPRGGEVCRVRATRHGPEVHKRGSFAADAEFAWPEAPLQRVSEGRENLAALAGRFDGFRPGFSRSHREPFAGRRSGTARPVTPSALW